LPRLMPAGRFGFFLTSGSIYRSQNVVTTAGLSA
jgi:hypothetical protein